jgi:class 3 adenylate cyclase
MRQVSHRYAAVLAADIAHFSRCMEVDGEGTVEALFDCRTIFTHCVNSSHGREFGSVGDSLMAEFGSPVEALRAARDFQQALKPGVGAGHSGVCLQARIGLHAGDVIFDGDSLFGDVVNTAARLQEISDTGGIVVSDFVHAQIKKETGYRFKPLGLQDLRNIIEPVYAYDVVVGDSSTHWHRIRLIARSYRSAIATVIGAIIAGLIFVLYFEARGPGFGPTITVPDTQVSPSQNSPTGRGAGQ